MVWTPKLSSALDGVPVYRAGRPPTPVPGVTPYKISSNENPYPPLPGVLEAVGRAAEGLNRYPSVLADEVVEALAARYEVDADRVAVAAGSVAVLTDLVGATCATGDEVVFPWRSFESYPIVTQLAGAKAVTVPLTATGEHDLDAMAAAVTDRTRLVLLCSPNNPTGPALRGADVRRFLDAVPEDVVVGIDEAYAEFVRDPEAVDAVEVTRTRRNVVSLRTFSKAYGLAGLRVGYAVADPLVITALRTVATPFGVSGVAQLAALASLEAEGELLERVHALVAERDRVGTALREQGWEFPDSQANFVWLPLGERVPEFAAVCEARGLSVRPFGVEGVRCTIAEPEANDTLLDVTRIFAKNAAPVVP